MVVVVSNNGVMLWEHGRDSFSFMVELSRSASPRNLPPLVVVVEGAIVCIRWLFVCKHPGRGFGAIATRLLGGQIVALEYVTLWIFLCSVVAVRFEISVE